MNVESKDLFEILCEEVTDLFPSANSLLSLPLDDLMDSEEEKLSFDDMLFSQSNLYGGF